MKQNWEIKKLAEVVEFQRGLTYSKNDEVDFSENIVLRSNNIDLATNSLDLSELKYINIKVVVPESKKVKKGTLMICTANGSKHHLGKVALIKEDLDYAFGGFMGLLTPHRALYPDYLYYLMISDSYKRFISELSDGANINNLKFSDLGEFEVPLPSLSEQKRIVAILDKAFAAIDMAIANTEKNLQNVRELFESYLEGVFVNNVENWIEMKLKDIGVTQTGTTPKTGEKENFGNYIPFIKPADVDFSGIGDIRYDNDGLSEIGLSKGRRIECGSILMVCIGATIGKVGFSEHEVSCNQQINTLTVRKGIEPKFIYFAMTSKTFQDKVLAEGKGAQATLPIINKSKWESLTIKIPVRQSEQQSFLKKLDDLQLEVKKMEIKCKAKLAYLMELRTSILQKAFSGEL